MIIWLIIFLFLLLILSLYINKSIIFPSNILALFFLSSSILSFILLNTLKSNITNQTLNIIILFVFLFIIFSNLGNYFGKNLFINFDSINKKKVVPYIHVSNIKIIIIILFQIISILLYIWKFKSMLGSINSTTLNIYRLTSGYSTIYKMPSWISFLNNISQMASFISLYILINNFYSSHKNNLKYILLFSSLLSVPIPLLNSSRYQIVIIALYAVTLYMYYAYYTSKNIKNSLVFTIIICILILLFFKFFGVIIGRSSSNSSGVEYYFGGGIVLFDNYIKNPFINNNGILGYQTFSSLYKNLFKLHLMNNYKTPNYPYGIINGVSIGNVYSCLIAYYGDFGIYGVGIISSVLGTIYGLIYNIVKHTHIKGINLKIIAYCYLSYTLALSPYSEVMFNTLLSGGFYINIFILYLLGKFYTK